ncbi:MAG: [FeFe] hydrogenase H-cluster radical SAM maturase HydE [Defluviitaleaceae bacterium]|nr:[FeFe] hydrogenase H-cluster radical SAM maturase HydE [Defluviitaleaceae bacterium]
MKVLVDKLIKNRTLKFDEFKELLATTDPYLHQKANEVRMQVFGNKIFARGLIEFTNYCKNDCFYCGLRTSNGGAARYRLTKEQILESYEAGYELGYRTFVLQGGEDPFFTDDVLVDLVRAIKGGHTDCAVTLSIGERSRESFQRLYDAGVDRYLLRQETTNPKHYASMHPLDMRLQSRLDCLWTLKEIGYQVGCGFMVGSPSQTLDDIVGDLMFIKELDPQMVGVGPFLPHDATPFGGEAAGCVQTTLNIIAILRLMKPNLLLPATTALGTIKDNGRELGIMAGANVVMPNISPTSERKKYLLYNNKIGTTSSAMDSGGDMARRMSAIGCELAIDRGDYNES